MSHHVLDARGLLCPMPVIKTQNEILRLAPGDTLEVIASDPGALNDIPAWCRIHGHKLVSTHRDEDDVRVRIEVCAT
ncbi:MAG: sulfurtransferase TusA family protein [Proteobacteria bacterium]|nr:MAG: sulfurtransferase TusA family protein [Pseudomonadota bacterium]QKK10486.1 MAG: sulfurtransferase TusA family protein [Pseudomonadota bacterium]